MSPSGTEVGAKTSMEPPQFTPKRHEPRRLDLSIRRSHPTSTVRPFPLVSFADTVWKSHGGEAAFFSSNLIFSERYVGHLSSKTGSFFQSKIHLMTLEEFRSLSTTVIPLTHELELQSISTSPSRTFPLAPQTRCPETLVLTLDSFPLPMSLKAPIPRILPGSPFFNQLAKS